MSDTSSNGISWVLPRVARATLCCVFLGSPCGAQALQEAREAISRSLERVAFAKSFGAIVLAADDTELSGASYRIDGRHDTELVVFALPFSTVIRPWDSLRHGIHLEGALGYAQMSERTDDLYQGMLPGMESSVAADWTTYGGMLGVGLSFEVATGVTATPIFNIGLSRIESDADYGGPGANFSRGLLDGIAFNWSALAVTHGGAAQIEWQQPLSKGYELTLKGRYDLRQTDSFQEDDPAHEFTARVQDVTFRGDLLGPTGYTLWDEPLTWRSTIGYRRFLEGDLAGADDVVQIGGALELSNALPLGTIVSLSGAVAFSNDLTGWSLALGVSF